MWKLRRLSVYQESLNAHILIRTYESFNTQTPLHRMYRNIGRRATLLQFGWRRGIPAQQ